MHTQHTFTDENRRKGREVRSVGRFVNDDGSFTHDSGQEMIFPLPKQHKSRQNCPKDITFCEVLYVNIVRCDL